MTAYQLPVKAILSPQQLEWFQSSETRQNILSYIQNLNEAVVGVKLDDECSESNVRAASVSHKAGLELSGCQSYRPHPGASRIHRKRYAPC